MQNETQFSFDDSNNPLIQNVVLKRPEQFALGEYPGVSLHLLVKNGEGCVGRLLTNIGPYIEESETTTASQASFLPASVLTNSSIASPPASSSPSTMNLTFTGSLPRSARIAATPLTWQYDWPLSSVEPRATRQSPSSVGSNGGLRQSSSGSAG